MDHMLERLWEFGISDGVCKTVFLPKYHSLIEPK